MQICLDSKRVVMIATKFFEQHHSDVIVKEALLEGEVWKVNVSLGLINKQNKQVKIDGKTGKILEYTSTDYERIAGEILAVSDAMRYVIIIDEKGTRILSKMKEGKTILFKNGDQITMISSELRTLRELLKFHNDDLGPARTLVITRDKVHIFIHFVPGITICSSCEYDVSNADLMEISEKMKSIIRRSVD